MSDANTSDTPEPVAPDAIDGVDVAPVPEGAVAAESDDGNSTITDAAKLIRLGTMTQSLMSEARAAPLDDAGRTLLARIHGETMEALEDTISKDLLDELREFQLCIDCGDEPPSESELRIAQAQLVGWLQGLHQGFQAMAVAQQAAAMQQLQQLQSGSRPPQAPEAIDAASRPGTYL
ncbi:MAG: proteasome activator [Acidimicrobiales bacterium]